MQRVAAVVLSGLLAACVSVHPPPSPEIRNSLAPTGKLRVGVYPGSPTSMVRDAASGEIKGVTVEVGAALASRLGVPVARVEYRRLAEVLDAMQAGQVDFTVTNATAERAKTVDFTQPLVSIELGYLVPSGSPIASLSDLDRSGVRVGVAQGSTSQRTLPARLKNAAVIAAPSLSAAIQMLSQGQLDAFATNKAILFEMSDALRGSRVLAGRWGLEHLAIAIPKGRDRGLPYVRQFAVGAITDGLVARAAERAGLRGSVQAD
jgi:polar amino acid transport system substrate-binding protein